MKGTVSTMEKKQNSNRNTSFAISIIAFIALFLICSFSLSTIAENDAHEYAVGSISSRTITAPKDLIDEYSTAIKREEAKQKVTPIYSTDATLMGETLGKVDSDLAAIAEIRAGAKRSYIEYYAALGLEAPSFNPESVKWEAILSDTGVRGLMSVGPQYMTESSTIAAASLSEDKLFSIRLIIEESLDLYYRQGILQEDIEDITADIEMQLDDSGSFTPSQKELAMSVVSNNLRANKVYDQEATESAKESAAESISEIVYKKNQNIVQKGEIITQAQFELIKQIGYTSDASISIPKQISAFLFYAILFTIAFAYLNTNDIKYFLDAKNLLSLVLLVLLGVLPTLLTRLIDSRISLVFLPVIIGMTTLKRRLSFAFAAFMSITLGVLHSTNSEFIFSASIMRYILSSFAGSYLAMITLKKQQHRREYVWAGFCAGVASAAVNIVYCLFLNATGEQYIEYAAIGLGSGLICGLLSVGVLPIWEGLFSISTPSKLLELSDPGSDLLRRVTYEIPGTYHHCVILANLAEAACDAIGADSLLARVSAYYHDLGKLSHPYMFKENQLHMTNPHDELPPLESAKIILNHVRDGVRLAKEYKLPKIMCDIIEQHHGTSLVYYFYMKAKNEGIDIQESDFRYPGPKPQTKEAAIIMMADTVEAAVRAKSLHDSEEIRSTIKGLIQGKINDGQLDECPISMRDLIAITEAFTKVFEGANHERIQYPSEQRNAQLAESTEDE